MVIHHKGRKWKCWNMVKDVMISNGQWIIKLCIYAHKMYSLEPGLWQKQLTQPRNNLVGEETYFSERRKTWDEGSAQGRTVYKKIPNPLGKTLINPKMCTGKFPDALAEGQIAEKRRIKVALSYTKQQMSKETFHNEERPSILRTITGTQGPVSDLPTPPARQTQPPRDDSYGKSVASRQSSHLINVWDIQNQKNCYC